MKQLIEQLQKLVEAQGMTEIDGKHLRNELVPLYNKLKEAELNTERVAIDSLEITVDGQTFGIIQSFPDDEEVTLYLDGLSEDTLDKFEKETEAKVKVDAEADAFVVAAKDILSKAKELEII